MRPCSNYENTSYVFNDGALAFKTKYNNQDIYSYCEIPTSIYKFIENIYNEIIKINTSGITPENNIDTSYWYD